MGCRALTLILTWGLLATPLAAGARPAGTVYRVGILVAAAPPAPSDRATMSFLARMALGERGDTEGQDLLTPCRVWPLPVARTRACAW
jgi:hypothetical protein